MYSGGYPLILFYSALRVKKFFDHHLKFAPDFLIIENMALYL